MCPDPSDGSNLARHEESSRDVESAPADTADESRSDPLVEPLVALGHDSIAIAGGKATNLGEMLRAGLPVPSGFCVTTAAYALAADRAGIAELLVELASVAATDTGRLSELAAVIRERLLISPVPDQVAAAVGEGVSALGVTTSLAVRSSATAEDLPFASFAGQQDTFLNVVGPTAVIEAVRRCWASLWTGRAVAYRARNAIDPRTVRLAVVVQPLIDAAVSGVLFTADPVTGRRDHAVVDASFGLGEAVVSGAVNPDHFVVAAQTGAVVERRLGDKRVAILPTPNGATHRVESDGKEAIASLSDDQLRTLTALGRRAEAHFGAPRTSNSRSTRPAPSGSSSPARSPPCFPCPLPLRPNRTTCAFTSASTWRRGCFDRSRRSAFRPSG